MAAEHCASVALTPGKFAITLAPVGVPKPVTCAGGLAPLTPKPPVAVTAPGHESAPLLPKVHVAAPALDRKNMLPPETGLSKYTLLSLNI